jgi:hypothetical protein
LPKYYACVAETQYPMLPHSGLIETAPLPQSGEGIIFQRNQALAE